MFTQTLNMREIIQEQRLLFATNQTKSIDFRLQQLKTLKKIITDHETEILNALKSDLNKAECEGFLSEVGVCLKELDYAIKNLKQWAKPHAVNTSIILIPGQSKIYYEPLGVVLIIGAWNYPFYLMIAPLVGAIASGNCAILKPSELAENTSNLLARLISKYFDKSFITVIEGGKETNQELLREKFDYIFFTGNAEVGKIVMSEAAKTLTPVTLELGGKSPCIVTENINLEIAAKRIIWGKFLNNGQTCVAPDYLLVNEKIKQSLLTEMKKVIKELYGENPAKSPDYGRIINDRHFQRLSELLKEGKIVIGGETNQSDRYISPTIIDQVTWSDKIMQEEIFGPILPILEYNDLTAAIKLVNVQPKPLALYFFSHDKKEQERILLETSSGGVAINDTIMQVASVNLPFGGVGNSGMGRYHGKASFETFSHQKSVFSRSFLIDIPLRYAPYRDKINILKWLFKL